jgi:hypothetical protein
MAGRKQQSKPSRVLRKAQEGRVFSPAGPPPSTKQLKYWDPLFGGAEAPPFLGLFSAACQTRLGRPYRAAMP